MNNKHVRYARNFAVGTSTHVVWLYDEYTDEQGLAGELDQFESPRMADCFKFLKGFISPAQESILRDCMREKLDVIVLKDGRIGR